MKRAVFVAFELASFWAGTGAAPTRPGGAWIIDMGFR